MIALRPATRDDIAEVLALWEDAAAEPSSTEDSAGIEALLARSPGAMIVAVDGNASNGRPIVGTVIAGWDGWRGALYRLAVEPSFRRRGIATALVAEAERHLHAHGARRMHLIVSPRGARRRETSGVRPNTSRRISFEW